MAFELTPEEEAAALETVREVNSFVVKAKDAVENFDNYTKDEIFVLFKALTHIAENAFGATQMALETNQILEQHNPTTN